jgi:hypothetical protein
MSIGFGGGDSFDTLDGEAVYGQLTVGTTPVELKVGASVLAGRSLVHMRAKDNSIYWGYSNTVTTTTGTRIFKDEFIPLAVGPNVQVWLVANGANKKISIGELA